MKNLARIIGFFNQHKKLTLGGGLGLLLIIIVLISLNRSQTPKTTKIIPTESPEQAIVKKNAVIKESVKEQISLPTDEEPIFATVSDREQLQNQDFFKQAQNGDKILMYPKNKKVFLYRPATNQVIATAPLDYKPSSAPEVAGDATASASVPNAAVTPHGKILIQTEK